MGNTVPAGGSNFKQPPTNTYKQPMPIGPAPGVFQPAAIPNQGIIQQTQQAVANPYQPPPFAGDMPTPINSGGKSSSFGRQRLHDAFSRGPSMGSPGDFQVHQRVEPFAGGMPAPINSGGKGAPFNRGRARPNEMMMLAQALRARSQFR